MLPTIALVLLLAAQSTPAPGPAPAPQQTPGSPTAVQQETPVSLAPGQTPASLAPGQPYFTPDGIVVYKVGSGVQPPKLIHKVDPKFPTEARKRRLSGMSLVGLIVDADGNPQNVHIRRAMADTAKPKDLAAAKSLDEQAVEAVRQYRFAPATRNGRPVSIELNVEVNFKFF